MNRDCSTAMHVPFMYESVKLVGPFYQGDETFPIVSTGYPEVAYITVPHREIGNHSVMKSHSLENNKNYENKLVVRYTDTRW